MAKLVVEPANGLVNFFYADQIALPNCFNWLQAPKLIAD
jgi:hypothetical protein